MLAAVLLLAGSACALPKWIEVAANGTWPQPRFSHTAVLLGNSSERMVVFGGNNFDAVNELFSYDVHRREWTQHKPAGEKPSKRYGHQAVGTADGRMVIFGGYNGSFLNDVHELKLDGSPKWRRIKAHGEPPIARDGHSAVLAPDGHTMLVFGGFDGKQQLDDVHALDTRTFTWTQLQPAPPAADSTTEDSEDEEASPSPRYLHTAVACDAGLLVFGGYLAGGAFAEDLWRLSLVPEDEAEGEAEGAPPDGEMTQVSSMRYRWERLRPAGPKPPGSMGHAAAVDADGNMWVSGGFGDGSFTNTLHVFQPGRNRWTRVDARGAKPSPRHKHTLVATAAGELLVFGGNDFGPTRGFFALDGAAALGATQGRSGGGAGVATAAPGGASPPALAQFGALVLVAVVAHLFEAGALSAEACQVALCAAVAALLVAEACSPPPGGLLLRMIGVPRRGGPSSGFSRSAVSMLTDAAAAVAAASIATLTSSGSLFAGAK